MHAKLAVSLLKLLQLLLCSDQLRVDEIHLLGGNKLFRRLIGLPWHGRLSPDVVERVLVVRFEIGMLEFPSLCPGQSGPSLRFRPLQLTPAPYGDWPPSSLLCRTLWKSYLFSCRTKLAKLLCLKCLGRMDFVNFSFFQCVSNEERRRGALPYLEDYKAVAFVSPPHHRLVCGILQHPGRMLALCLDDGERTGWTYLYSLRTWTQRQLQVHGQHAISAKPTKSLELAEPD